LNVNRVALSLNSLKGTKSVIFGLKGLELSKEEEEFFRSSNPLGFILFARNCQDKVQVLKLVDDLKKTVKHDNPPILIDQEGGRVVRLKPPHFRPCPPAKIFADIAEKDIELAKQAAYLNAFLLGQGLAEFGITVDCAPVADLLIDGAHSIIGDRSYGQDPYQVAELAASMCQGLIDAGIVPIIKHIPGHGRAKVDSHEELPIVEANIPLLKQTDFVPFTELSDAPWAMTAHVVYDAIDALNPGTLSPYIINVIREYIGFEGIIVSDDLSMKALGGSYKDRTKGSFNAGCDIVLHCNGEMNEMVEIIEAVPNLNERTKKYIDISNKINANKKQIKNAEEDLQKLIALVA
jgi:beta-N-acetylhexosaminidase